MTETTTKDRILSVAADLGLTMTTKFVPWSQSRKAGEKQPSLNWLVTLHKRTRDAKDPGPAFLTTDYMAGQGHCPAYKASVKELGHQNSLARDEVIRWECEHGLKSVSRVSMGIVGGTTPIVPDFADVLHSLVSDSDVIDYGTFEEWAGELGYDTDSRAAEKTYQACLAIALKLRNALGEAGLTALREACQDY